MADARVRRRSVAEHLLELRSTDRLQQVPIEARFTHLAHVFLAAVAGAGDQPHVFQRGIAA